MQHHASERIPEEPRDVSLVFEADFVPEIPAGATNGEALEAFLGTVARIEVFRRALDDALFLQQRRVVETAQQVPGFSWPKLGIALEMSGTGVRNRFDEDFAEKQRAKNRAAMRKARRVEDDEYVAPRPDQLNG